MKIIAHRANVGGANPNLENRISSIDNCLKLGFDVEIDIRRINNKFYLGHDQAEEIITKDKLIKIKNKAWIHCKNLEAISYFYQSVEEFNFFWHQNDFYTLTSKGYLWTYPGQELSVGCISVLPVLHSSKISLKFLKNLKIAGICTDYPDLFI